MDEVRRSLRLTLVGTEYWVRPPVPAHSAAFLRDQLAAQLLADGPAGEDVIVNFASGTGLDPAFDGHSPKAMSLGWELIVISHEERRSLRLPKGVAVTSGAHDVGLDPLRALVPVNPWVMSTLASPHLDLSESLLIRRDGDLLGWIPVWRPAPTTSIIRFVVVLPHVFAGEERRLTHLRLSAYSQAVDRQCRHGRTVISWIPDDGDPVNALKLSVASPARITHWKSIRVRRDLALTTL